MKEKNKNTLVAAIAVLGVAALGYGIYEYYTLYQNNLVLQDRIAELEESLASTQNILNETANENALLTEALQNEQNRLNSIQDTLDEVTSTVSNLEKLNKLDPELLQKYSKVYFLNEHYTPDDLYTIDDPEYLYYEDGPEEIHRKVWPFLRELLEDAQDDDMELFVVSGYRSFGTQAALKSGYVVTYGAGTANTFSAEQGFSEHQLGTTVDFMTTGIGGTFSGFQNTPAYEWLLDNAHKYGFVLSYPEGNTYYQFEPWHWRFVGEELAEHLHDNGIHFYDMTQPAIDEYLLEIFD